MVKLLTTVSKVKTQKSTLLILKQRISGSALIKNSALVPMDTG